MADGQASLIPETQTQAETTAPAVVPRPAADALAPASVSMFERLARDPTVPVEKLEKLIELQERILDREARTAFNISFSELQAALPTVIERGRGDKNMAYALYEDIVEAVRPVLQQYGFSVSHRTEWPDKRTVKVVGILTHRDGHSRESEFMADADQSGSKNAIQALGSAVSYGKRYTLRDLLNIASREDDDGKAAGRLGKEKQRPESSVPEGFEDWVISLETVAEDGYAKLSETWKASPAKFREEMFRSARQQWEQIKKAALKNDATRVGSGAN